MPRRLPFILLAIWLCPIAAWAVSSGDLGLPGQSADWWRVISLRDYNTRVVLLGASLQGLAAGLIGTYMLLRKRSLLGDAVSHATLPGIGLAFLVLVAHGQDGKALHWLLLGGLLSGLAGLGLIVLIQHATRLKEDAALGLTLSVFFGLGVAILGIIQGLDRGHAAGLESFIYGKTAAMLARDAWLIGGGALLVALTCTLGYKEFRLLCFDPGFAAAQGWPVLTLDTLLMALVVLVTVIGLQAVGLILVIALLIIPPAAARFWSDRLVVVLTLAGLLGGASAFFGAGLSALYPRLPAGAIIVLMAGAAFVVSLVFGRRRGLLWRWLQHRRTTRKVRLQNLLRECFEHTEGQPPEAVGMTQAALLQSRSWTPAQLRAVLAQAQADDLIFYDPQGHLRLTASGLANARRITRNHRLWETYLITQADVAPGRVDRDADRIEHVLGEELVAHLEDALHARNPALSLPASPHPPPPGGPPRSANA